MYRSIEPDNDFELRAPTLPGDVQTNIYIKHNFIQTLEHDKFDEVMMNESEVCVYL